MKHKGLFILLFSLSLYSCKSSCKSNDINVKTNSNDIYIAYNHNNYDGGRIIGGGGLSSDPILQYLDYNTMEAVVLCTRPNCTHKSGDCAARIMGTTPMITDEGVYFFKYEDSIIEKKDGKRELNIKSKLCRMSLDSSEIETIAEFNDCEPRETDGYVLHNNKIYFTGDDLNPRYDDYGGIFTSNCGGTHYICSIDINTGEYINYGSVYDDDKQYEGAQFTSSATIRGIYNSKMLINYEFSKTPEPVPEKLWSGMTELVFEFDFDTNGWTLSDIPTKPVFTDSDTVVYYDEKIDKTVIIDKGERTELDIKIDTYASVQNNKLFVRDDYDNGNLKWYDLEDMSEHNVEGYANYMPDDFYNNCYILSFGNNIKKLSEEELLALDK